METGDILYATCVVVVLVASFQFVYRKKVHVLIKIIFIGGGFALLREFDTTLSREINYSLVEVWRIIRLERAAIIGVVAGMLLSLRDYYAPGFTQARGILAIEEHKARAQIMKDMEEQRGLLQHYREEMNAKIAEEQRRAMQQIDEERDRLNREHAKAMKELVRAKQKNAYDVLGVSNNASKETVRNRYRDLARRFHPDTVATNPDAIRELSEAKMKELNAAYEQVKE